MQKTPPSSEEYVNPYDDRRLIKCDGCGYRWLTRSSLYWVTCPSCTTKTRHPDASRAMKRQKG